MRFAHVGTACISLLLSFAALSSAQTKLPIKAGLWLEDVTTTITGIEGVTPTPQKDVERACISADTWKQHALQATNATGCTMANLQEDSHKVSYDESCGSQPSGVLVFHMEILIDNDENMHGTAVAKTPGSDATHAGNWNSVITARFIGPSCGDLKPGEQKAASVQQ